MKLTICDSNSLSFPPVCLIPEINGHVGLFGGCAWLKIGVYFFVNQELMCLHAPQVTLGFMCHNSLGK